MSNDYIPIPCAFYDELEAAAVKKIDCEIVYLDKENKKTINTKVVDFKTSNKEEFVILANNQKIRLDKIVLFNNLSPKDKNYC
ncbi:Rho-binding antiterminator [Arcobacter sp. LA11]|uniref:Rho-binding antiterminator n=1 Tax=Arcobacter sp. LA11 TaxID=1898176 RepID=UPI0009344E5B|nr:Rho-binding antiterminator [Arcobacter sp. LA11]